IGAILETAAAVIGVVVGVDAGARAFGQSRRARRGAGAVHADLRRAAGGVARAAMVGVRREIGADAAAVGRARALHRAGARLAGLAVLADVAGGAAVVGVAGQRRAGGRLALVRVRGRRDLIGRALRDAGAVRADLAARAGVAAAAAVEGVVRRDHAEAVAERR